MTEDPVKQAREQVEEAYHKFRSSGFGLMATIITLSTGGIVGIQATSVSPKSLLFLLFLPVAGALFQQLSHYLGELYRARHLFALYAFLRWQHDTENLRKAGYGDDYANQCKTDTEINRQESNCWFRVAEYACIGTVIGFIIIGFIFLAAFNCSKAP